jgi:hypothetical protein
LEKTAEYVFEANAIHNQGSLNVKGEKPAPLTYLDLDDPKNDA